MKRIAVITGLTLGLGLSTILPGWAQNSYTGRITYLDQNKRQMMLDNHYLYRLAPEINTTGLGIAEMVSATGEQKGGEEVALAVTPAPAKSSSS